MRVTLSSSSTLVGGNSLAETPPLPTHLASQSAINSEKIKHPSVGEISEIDSPGEFLNTGARVGRYEIIRMIGRGGMGTVYEATDTQLHRRVAFKTLIRQLTGRAEAVRRFFLEAQAAGRLMHPNVVAIFDFNADGDIPFMAMELLKGEPLSTAIRKGPMPPKRVADAMLGVCAGIESAHKAGIIHRDLKPSNIFLAVDWNGHLRPRILDFGISKIRDISSGGLTQTGDIIGTSQYLSPEHAAANGMVDALSDIYSLGVVIYEAITQRTPQQGEPVYQLLRNVIEGRWQPPHVYCPNLPSAFEAVIMRAMQLLPKDRFPSAFEMGRALFPFASSRVKRQFDEYYNGTGVLSLPGTDGVKAEEVVAKDPGIRTDATEVLPAGEVPDWQEKTTHTALPHDDPEPSRSLQEMRFIADSTASSSDIAIPSSKHGWRWILLCSLVLGIALVALWHSPRTIPVERSNKAEKKPPLLVPSNETSKHAKLDPSPTSVENISTNEAPLPVIEQPIVVESPESPLPTESPPNLERSTPSTPIPTVLGTKPNYTFRKKGKYTPTVEEKMPVLVTQPPTPPQPLSALPCREKTETSQTSLDPISNEESAASPTPDRW